MELRISKPPSYFSFLLLGFYLSLSLSKLFSSSSLSLSLFDVLSLSRFQKRESKNEGKRCWSLFIDNQSLLDNLPILSPSVSLFTSLAMPSFSPLLFSNFNLKSLHSHASRLLISALYYSHQSI